MALVALLLLIASPTATQATPLISHGTPVATLSTTYFEIHFPVGQELLATHLIYRAEMVYKTLILRLDRNPRRKIHIVLASENPEVNAWAANWPYPVITVYPNFPYGGSEPEDFDNWWDQLLTHEMTHIMHLDMVHGIWGGLRSVFGTIVNSQQLNPLWTIEGMAVYQESEESRGRATSAWTKDMLCSMIAEGNFMPMDRISYFQTTYPAGSGPYNIGGAFHEFLARHHMPGTWKEYAHAAGGGVPWLTYYRARESFGKSFGNWYEDWQDSLAHRWNPLLDSLREELPYPPDTLAGPFKNLIRLSLDAETRWGYALVYEWDGDPKLVRFPVDGGKTVTLFSRPDLVDFRVATVGLGFWAILRERRDPTAAVNRIVRLNDEGEIELALRGHPDVRDLLPLPGDSVLLAEVESGDSCALVRIRPTEGVTDTLLLYTDGTILRDLASVGPNRIMAAQHGPQGWYQLVEINLVTLEVVPQTRCAANFRWPASTAAGDYLLYGCDQAESWQLFAADRARGGTYRLFRLAGGIRFPQPTLSGREIVVSTQTARGASILRLNWKNGSWVAQRVVDPLFQPPNAGWSRSVPFRRSDYSVFTGFLPSYWLPSVEAGDRANRFGFSTSSTDPVERLGWSLSGGWYLDAHAPWYNLGLDFSGWYPELSGEAWQTGGPAARLLAEGDSVRRVEGFRGEEGFRFRFAGPHAGTAWAAGWRFGLERASQYYRRFPEGTPPLDGSSRTGAWVEGYYTSRRAMPTTYGAWTGSRLTFRLGAWRPIAGTNQRYNLLQVDAAEVLPVWAPRLIVAAGARWSQQWGLAGASTDRWLEGGEMETFHATRGFTGPVTWSREGMASFSAEARILGLEVQRGVLNLPLAVDRVFLIPFLDAVWAMPPLRLGDFEAPKTVLSGGGEGVVRMTWFYALKVDLVAGAAWRQAPGYGYSAFWWKLSTTVPDMP